MPEPISTFSPGTLINSRRRLWRVDAQDGQVLYVTAVDDAQELARLYLEFETTQPGKIVPPAAEVGYPQAQELMLRAFRLSMMHSTAPLLSLQRSRVIPVSYQLVPVVMGLQQPRVRMLIADDVGLGKTIEAGLVISELMARGQARRVLVVCPASLREQWKDALDRFFHIETHLFSRQHRRGLERDMPAGMNPWEFHNVFVVSMDYAKMPEIKNQILEVPWDVVAMDEAHQFAKPHQNGPDQRTSMDRWDLAKSLAFSQKVRHLLLLTATPHNGYTDTFASLLRLLDVGAVSGSVHAPIINRAIARHHVVQRRRQDVDAWLTTGEQAFPTRDQEEAIVQPSESMQTVIKAVQNYGEMILEHAKDANLHVQTLATWTVLHLHKRVLSSPEALRRSLKNRREALEQQIAGLTESDAGLSADTARANVLDEDPGEQFDEEEIVTRAERVLPGTVDALKAELEALEELTALAKKLTVALDTKLQDFLKKHLWALLGKKPKVIVFTRYRDTMEYIEAQIGKSDRYKEVTVVPIHGGLNDAQRREAFQKFESASRAVLVATDAISEGMNLQHIASQIIHYELPWNPNRLEQRNGRVDRFGQPEKTVTIRTLVMDETLDATIMKVLVEKSRRIREDYGFSPPFFGDETNMLELIREHGMTLGAKQLSFFDALITTSTDEVKDPFSDDVLSRIQDESFYGQNHISLDEVEQKMRATNDAIGTADEIKQFVLSGLNRLRCDTRDNGDGTYRIILNHPDLRLPGLSTELERVTFEPQKDGSDVIGLDLGHPLVRRLIEMTKREAFEPDPKDSTRYGRTAVMLTKDAPEVTALYTLLVRFVVGTQPPQILEDLMTVAIPVYGDQPFDAETTRKLIHAKPVSGKLTMQEQKDVIAEALNRTDFESHADELIAARKKSLIEERRSLQSKLTDAGQAPWLAGADQISIGSWDLLAVKVLWAA
jgi:ERCC4-related helicase